MYRVEYNYGDGYCSKIFENFKEAFEFAESLNGAMIIDIGAIQDIERIQTD